MSWHGVRDVISRVSHHVHHTLNFRGNDALREIQDPPEENMPENEVTYNDLTIHFIGASGLPKMDVLRSADPYFVADLDGKISIV